MRKLIKYFLIFALIMLFLYLIANFNFTVLLIGAPIGCFIGSKLVKEIDRVSRS